MDAKTADRIARRVPAGGRFYEVARHERASHIQNWPTIGLRSLDGREVPRPPRAAGLAGLAGLAGVAAGLAVVAVVAAVPTRKALLPSRPHKLRTQVQRPLDA